MAKDVVCGMDVTEKEAAAVSEYKGKNYYFCSTMCKTKFDANPNLYIESKEKAKNEKIGGDAIEMIEESESVANDGVYANNRCVSVEPGIL